MPSPRAVPVTLAEIARIAGVGRAAVSNWRRRHDSFPARIGGTDASPQFSLTEVEQWLRENGKLKDVGGRELLWPGFEALGSRDETGLAIAEAGRRMRGARARSSDPRLSDRARELIDEAVALGKREGDRETFEFLLQRWLDAHVRQVSASPRPLAALMTEVAFALRPPRAGAPLTVLDPACGAGHILDAAARAAVATGADPVALLGCEIDPAPAALAAARLAFVRDADGNGDGGGAATADVRRGDSLRADPHAAVTADVVLCNPPFNERDWGYEQLSTDRRWAHGLPPRTESELAWVQHCLARLRPGGVAVLLLPPAVASRRAGRRIRGALLRAGLLRGVIALPPGAAQPHSVSLHLWLLRSPGGAGPSASADGSGVLLADAAARRAASREGGVDWESLGGFVRDAVTAFDRGEHDLPDGARRVAAIDLLDEEVDLTPGRHVSPATRGEELRLPDVWREFTGTVEGLRATGRALEALVPAADDGRRPPTTTVGELVRAGALVLRGGQQPPDGTVTAGEPGEDGIPLLTVPDLLQGGAPTGWLRRAEAVERGALVAEPGDVVVAGVIRAFTAWVHQGPPTVLGAQLHSLRVDPEKLDAWFLAGCLRAPSNGRQAGTHASSASRVDVRRLQVLQIPLAEQLRHSEAFRRLTSFEEFRARLDELGSRLARDLGDGLASGRLTPGG
ncbi:N-6 DNA methylase [Streptomyces sp. TRM43335]|uniref:N-6 DNA methylase n=1 Tax=Streptomyces taklimakanensis TaxID=2569853 RepID=A0A6G2BHP6_9ACTN|nr:N-6 DNA methylase [Streptomyces taklimakanensis]MTE21646.1 N-6 DNA methylase [Streptomyces taklimakanensis]